MKLISFIFILCVIANYASADLNNVKYVHLALTDDSSEMVVGWYTEDPTDSSIVQYGTESGAYSFNATGTSSYWKQGYGYNHFVKLTNLKPSTKYYYVCGTSNDTSDELTFTSAPQQSRDYSFSIAVCGDMGIDYSTNTINGMIDRAKSNEFDWILHVGDISYADDHVFTFQSTWNTWFSMVEPLSGVMPYMVCPGNHEYASKDPLLHDATKNFVVYNARFMMPNANSKSEDMYYSFDYGNVHFIAYSTETSFPNAPYGDAAYFADELAWLEADLKNANLPENRQKYPWIVVFGHRPIYSSCEGYSKGGVPIDHTADPPSNSATLQKTFEDLFQKYQVDVIFNGHVHSYERNYPAYQNQKTSDYNNPKSPFNIVIGNAGNIEGLENHDEEKWTQPQPEWSAFRYGSDYGFGVLTFHNGTDMDWKFYRATDNVLHDQVSVHNDHSS